MGSDGHSGLDASAGGPVCKKCGDNRAKSGVKKGFSERCLIGNADAQLLYQSSGSGADHRAQGGIAESESPTVKTCSAGEEAALAKGGLSMAALNQERDAGGQL